MAKQIEVEAPHPVHSFREEHKVIIENLNQLDEQRLIEQTLKDDKPVLGVCLGSQLLATPLDAEVKSGAKKEIGWHPVALTEAATADALWEGVPSRFTA